METPRALDFHSIPTTFWTSSSCFFRQHRVNGACACGYFLDITSSHELCGVKGGLVSDDPVRGLPRQAYIF